jgi:hypothetical protein
MLLIDEDDELHDAVVRKMLEASVLIEDLQ